MLTWVLPSNFCYFFCTWAAKSMRGISHVDISFICWFRVLFCAFWSPCSSRSWWNGRKGVRKYNSWCSNPLEGLFERIPETFLSLWLRCHMLDCRLHLNLTYPLILLWYPDYSVQLSHTILLLILQYTPEFNIIILHMSVFMHFCMMPTLDTHYFSNIITQLSF